MKGKLGIGKKYAFYVSTMGLILLTVTLISVSIIVWRGANTLKERLSEGTKENYAKNYETMIINRARNFSYDIFNSLYRLDIDRINLLIKNLKAEMPIKSVLIADAPGKVLTDGTNENLFFGTILNADFPKLKSRQSLLIRTAEGHAITFIVASGDHIAGYGEILFLDDPLKDTFQQQDEMVFSMWKQTQTRFRGIALIGVLFILFFTVFLGLLFSRTLSSPVLKLRDAIKRVAKGDLQYRLEIQSRDELGDLADSFNRMAEELLLTTVSKDYVDKIIKNMNDSLIVVSPEGTIKTVNQATLDLLGYTQDELLNQSVGIIFEDKQLASEGAGFNDLMKEDSLTVRHIEKTCLSKDGRKIPILLSGSVMRDGDGKIQGIVYVALDITERKAAEEELRRHREHLEELVKNRTIELTEANKQLQEEIGERRWAEESLIRGEEEARGLAQENAIMAEIGRIISSTLNIEDVYERFAQEVNKLLPFDRIAINHINPNDQTAIVAYATGIDIEERQIGDTHSLFGTATGEVLQKKSIFFFQTDDSEELSKTFPHLLPSIRAKFKSFLSVPLFSKDEVIGVLHFRSTKPNAYSERDLRLSERVGNQIAGAIANAQLFAERKQVEESLKRSEEEARRLAQENAIVAEIGRIISSTLNIEEVYERFAEEVRKLLHFDRIAVNMINPDERTITIAYSTGVEIPERFHGNTVPLAGTFTEEVLRRRKSQLIQEEEKEIINRFPGLLFSLKIGLRSMISVPLISKDEVIGVLHFRSTKPNAYSERDLSLAERVGNQIAGAIANAQLFAERKQVEESLKRSEEEARRLSQENAIMAEIGRIISSTFNIEEVYERFAEEVRKLIPLDRIVISTINPDERALTIIYVAGVEVADRCRGDSVPLAGSLTEETIRTRSGLLIPTGDADDLMKRFPILLNDFQAGIRSMMSIPLISKDQVIGVLHIRSTKPNAYSERDLKLAERVANQIAGAIANAQLFAERIRAEEKAKGLEEQLLQSQKMEAIDQLAGGIAYDFNNLLTVIKGYSQFGLLKLKEDDPLKGDLEEIQRAADGATNLTQQLLAFSHRQVLEFKVFDLNAILRDLSKILRRIIGEDIELIYRLSDDMEKIKTDPGQMEQVIINLVFNAMDAMPSGGKLTLETANVELDKAYIHTDIGLKPGRYVMLSMSDTGIGMSPEVKKRIFEPFFTTKERMKGTGLGLSTVYGIIKQSRGHIEVYSELGQGTTFKIYLPSVEEEVDLLPLRDEKGDLPSGTETILLVEDEPSVRSLVSRILRDQGYHVLEAGNGDEALEIAKGHHGHINLLLTDVVMLQRGAKGLAEQIKPLRNEIKVLFTSGYTDTAIIHHGVLSPGFAFLQKPFTPSNLLHKVREVLDK